MYLPKAKIYVQKLLFTHLQMNEYEDVIKILCMETKIHANHPGNSLETFWIEIFLNVIN